MSQSPENQPGQTTHRDVVRFIANAIFCAIIWGIAAAVGVDVFGNRWGLIDVGFRLALGWFALNATSSAFWIGVSVVRSMHPEYSSFQCIFMVALYGVAPIVAGTLITLQQAGVIELAIWQLVLITLGVAWLIVGYCSLGMWMASRRRQP
jgi:hypothetical protein